MFMKYFGIFCNAGWHSIIIFFYCMNHWEFFHSIAFKVSIFFFDIQKPRALNGFPLIHYPIARYILIPDKQAVSWRSFVADTIESFVCFCAGTEQRNVLRITLVTLEKAKYLKILLISQTSTSIRPHLLLPLWSQNRCILGRIPLSYKVDFNLTCCCLTLPIAPLENLFRAILILDIWANLSSLIWSDSNTSHTSIGSRHLIF